MITSGITEAVRFTSTVTLSPFNPTVTSRISVVLAAAKSFANASNSSDKPIWPKIFIAHPSVSRASVFVVDRPFAVHDLLFPHPEMRPGRDCPPVQVVTLPAVHRKTESLMIRCPGSLKRLHVAAHARGGESLTIESADGSHLVTGVAIHHGVCTDQGKAILMLVDVLDGHLPAVDP